MGPENVKDAQGDPFNDIFFAGCVEYRIDGHTSSSSCPDTSSKCASAGDTPLDSDDTNQSDPFFDGCVEHRISQSLSMETNYQLSSYRKEPRDSPLQMRQKDPGHNKMLSKHCDGFCFSRYISACNRQMSSYPVPGKVRVRENSPMITSSDNDIKLQHSHRLARPNLSKSGFVEYSTDETKLKSKLVLNYDFENLSLKDFDPYSTTSTVYVDHNFIDLPSESLFKPINLKTSDTSLFDPLNCHEEVLDDSSNSDIDVAKGVQILNDSLDCKERQPPTKSKELVNDTTLREKFTESWEPIESDQLVKNYDDDIRISFATKLSNHE